MPTRFDPRAEIQRIRWEFAYIDLKLKRERLRLALRYDESQPRAPAGSPSGGQWVGSGGGASGNGGGDASHRRAPQTTVRTDGTRQEVRQSTTADSSWLAVEDIYRPDGSLATQTVYNRDTSVIDSQFAPADGSVPWDSRHTIYAPDGRILTVQNAGPLQTLFDTHGQAISQSIWRPDGPEPQDLVQPAFVPALVLAPAAAKATVELALILYAWMAAQKLLDQKPVIAFKARDYEREEPDNAESLDLNFVGWMARDKVELACPRMSDVQTMTNASSEAAGSRDLYKSAASYGTAVHVTLKNKILADKESRKENGLPDTLLPEESLLKSNDEGKGNYGEKGTIRIDVLEDAGNETVCVYDIKTGVSGLLPGRSAEIAAHVTKFNRNAKRIIVTEVRPFQ
ncbi:hypothetical protein [Azorhizobium sp. AG788]|uniref:hypothetical protein n=1 Tax=Azorhizobium sp. AG788 TaxID=2183897 RepID=UPI00313A314F